MSVQIIVGDALESLRQLATGSVHCCVTSPPYWGLRSYMPDAVILREDLTPEQAAYVADQLKILGIKPFNHTGD